MCKLRRNLRFAKLRLRGPLAQLAEQLTLNQQVRGSIPLRLTLKLFPFADILRCLYLPNRHLSAV